MRLTITTLEDNLVTLEISGKQDLAALKYAVEDDLNMFAEDMVVSHNGVVLEDVNKTLNQLGLRNGDLLFVEPVGTDCYLDFLYDEPAVMPRRGKFRNTRVVQQGGSVGQTGFIKTQMQDPGHVRDLLMENPDQLALLRQNNPRLSDALNSGRLETFARVLKEQINEKEKRRKHKIKLMNAHPFDLHAQRLIAEEIRQQNVEANMEAAMEYNPETFGSVVMLYIDCRVNGYPVKAFVDSGAQTTIMSSKCAERCNIMRLIDTRWAGVAKGVGVQQIIGRIHMVQIAIERDYLTTSLSILEEQPMDMLLGLDMLKRHQCCIDLRKNLLRIGTTGTETKFLSEKDLPECARPSSSSDEEYE